MRRRLGEQLVVDDVISEAQLQQALRLQQQLGGRLGTNLIEGAALGEADLLKALGSHHGTRTADRQQLESIAPAVIRLLPGKLAQRYQLVPYGLQGKTLLIASADVVDAIIEDEIRMLTGHMVRTSVALELRVKLALEQFYRVPCGVRFTSLGKRIDSGSLRPGARREPRPESVVAVEEDAPPSHGPPLSRRVAPASGQARQPQPAAEVPTPQRPPPGQGALQPSPHPPTGTHRQPTSEQVSPRRPSFARQQPVAPVPPPPAHSPPAAPKPPPPRTPATFGRAQADGAAAKPRFIELDDEDAELLRSMRSSVDATPVEVQADQGATAQSSVPEDQAIAPAPEATAITSRSVDEPPMGEVEVWDPGGEELDPEAFEPPADHRETADDDSPFEDPVAGDPISAHDSILADDTGLEDASVPGRDAVLEPSYDDPSLSLEERLDVAAAKLQEVDIRDEIADVLLGFAAPYLERRLLLFRRQERIIGWRGEGPGVVEQALRAVEIESREPSVFTSLTGATSLWLGPLPPLEPNRRLVAGLGGAAPKDCIVLPLVLRSKIVCYLYGDNRQEGVSGAPLAELRRLLAKAGLAFEIYILKNKMRLL